MRDLMTRVSNTDSEFPKYCAHKPILIRRLRLFAVLSVCILAVLTSIFVYNRTMRPRYLSQSYDINNDKPVGEILPSTQFNQTFESSKDIDAVSLLLATYARKNTSQLSVQIKNLTLGQIVLDKTFPAENFLDNSHYLFVFENDDTYEGSAQYEIRVSSPDASPGNAVTIWSSGKDEYIDGQLFLNNGKLNSDLVFASYVMDDSYHPIKLYLNRLVFVVLFFAFVIMHLLISPKKLYDWIFNRRLLIVIAIIFFFTINQYHFSSIGMYDGIIQPNQGSEFVDPIWGTPRGIRSDEWLVVTPSKLSSQYSNYGEYNDVLRAEHSPNLPASGLYRDYSALAKPLDWIFLVLGVEYGIAFNWISFLMLTLLFSFELFLLFSKGNRLVSIFGATLITFSSYFLWWSFVVWIMAGQAALVLIHHFIHTNMRWKRALYGAGTSVFGAFFAISLYPAWQVPAGILYLGLLVWILAEGRDKLKAFSKIDYLLLVGTVLFFVSITADYLIEYRSYMTAIMNTVYPGKRVSFGGFALNKLSYYLISLVYPFRDILNPSEYSVVLNFYPIPTILATYLLIRKKGKDLLTAILLSISLLMTIYCSIGLPSFLSKILLFTFSSPMRMVDILGVIQVYLLVVALSRFDGIRKFSPFWGWTISLLAVEAALYFCRQAFPAYLPTWGMAILVNSFIIVCALLLTEQSKKVQSSLLIGIMCISIASGLFVNPIMKGLDVIYTKPVANVIQNIVKSDKDGKWISVGSLVDSGFLVACGAPTINSVNYIPNTNLWKILDVNGQYAEVYNRYAHMSVELVTTETSAKLQTNDHLLLSLSYDDLQEINIKYVFSRRKLEDRQLVDFDLKYEDSGIYIYKVNYLT